MMHTQFLNDVKQFSEKLGSILKEYNLVLLLRDNKIIIERPNSKKNESNSYRMYEYISEAKINDETILIESQIKYEQRFNNQKKIDDINNN